MRQGRTYSPAKEAGNSSYESAKAKSLRSQTLPIVGERMLDVAGNRERAIDALAVCDSKDTQKVKHDIGKGREYTLSVECSERGEECVRAKLKSGKGGKGEANPVPIQHEIQALEPAGKAETDATRVPRLLIDKEKPPRLTQRPKEAF
ncbi:hypothetical protein NMY22_g3587 [Coprinellus aureogranulatus]|nr:hypothetical protein NMY22_g3587 [Coprinellus aureogranulatus]